VSASPSFSARQLVIEQFGFSFVRKLAIGQVESLQELAEAEIDVGEIRKVKRQNRLKSRRNFEIVTFLDANRYDGPVLAKWVAVVVAEDFNLCPCLLKVVPAPHRNHLARCFYRLIEFDTQVVSGLEVPLVEPNSHAFVAQPFGKLLAPRPVFAGVGKGRGRTLARCPSPLGRRFVQWLRSWHPEAYQEPVSQTTLVRHVPLHL
jgi:hypothetical protein